MGHSRRAGESLPVVSALVLLGAVGFTLVAAYQWAGILGIFGEATTLAPGNWQGHVWQGHVWNTVLAIILWFELLLMPRGPRGEKRPADVIGALIGNVEAHP